jgi:hypothetical protein
MAPFSFQIDEAAPQIVASSNEPVISNGIEWNIEKHDTPFMAGEPVLLRFVLTNRNESERRIDFGWNGVGAFSFEIIDAKGDSVAYSGAIGAREGVTRGDVRTLSPGATERKAIILNRFCFTLLPPGKYRIRSWCRQDILASSGSKIESAPSLAFETQITLIERDPAKLIARLDEIELQARAASVAVPTGERNAIDAQWREGQVALDLIAYAEGPEAWPYQLRLLRRELSWMYDFWRQINMIRNRLAKSASPQVAAELVRIYEEVRFPDNLTHPEINAAIYRLRDSGKPEILAVTQDFAARHPRSPGSGAILD